jgi:hypothetical protein
MPNATPFTIIVAGFEATITFGIWSGKVKGGCGNSN